ncbi:processed acidic surface protein [Alkalihalobacillus sp. LMS6]|uniref:processed acidic surface protein n=1 Tax=Alkalihalobacillus sp. LMS6 TaxID=2924034 RepID=UPI0020D0A14D|nr:processed acidic surface protein [Alkalihalobacillus sp. LMS6]UTR06301.1 processed acidic surface protein [Alkalihalobacillus sp. LMS6]
MKRLLSLSLIFTLIFALVAPNLSFAHSLDRDELNEYLEYIEMTEEELEIYLNDRWQTALDEFGSVEELEAWLGDLLTEEDYYALLDEFGITEEEFLALLEELMVTMDYFIFYDDLFYFLVAYYGYTEEDFLIDVYTEILRNYLDAFELEDTEARNLMEHFLEVRKSNENLAADLNALKERGLSFKDGEFESIRELTPQEIAELFAIGEKAIDLLDLKPEYFIDAEGKEKQRANLQDLMKNGITKGYDLRVELSNTSGDYLADFYITAAMFNSHFVKGLLDDVSNIGDKVDEKLNETPVVEKHEKPSKEAPTSDGSGSNAPPSGTTNTSTEKLTKTVDGAKMPKTSSYYPLYALLGLGLMASGLFVFRRLMKKEAV